MQRLRNAADLLRDRHHRCPSRGVIPLVVENHPYRAFANFRRKLVRRLAHTGSTFSGVGASDKPGAVLSYQALAAGQFRPNADAQVRNPTSRKRPLVQRDLPRFAILVPLSQERLIGNRFWER